MRWPRIELGSTAWKAAMLTIIPPTLHEYVVELNRLNVELVQQQMPMQALTFKLFIPILWYSLSNLYLILNIRFVSFKPT
jgi:hypothetical protein